MQPNYFNDLKDPYFYFDILIYYTKYAVSLLHVRNNAISMYTNSASWPFQAEGETVILIKLFWSLIWFPDWKYYDFITLMVSLLCCRILHCLPRLWNSLVIGTVPVTKWVNVCSNPIVLIVISLQKWVRILGLALSGGVTFKKKLLRCNLLPLY